jgi:hypothetical protein
MRCLGVLGCSPYKQVLPLLLLLLLLLLAVPAVYRDVLHGAGVVDVLMAALTDAALLADLQLVQVCQR